jgi:hypothetical protein
MLAVVMLGAAGACSPDSSSRDTAGGRASVPPEDAAVVATFEGVGRLRAGMRVREALAALGGTIDTSRGTMPGSNCSYARFSELPAGTAIMLWADTIVRIDVDSAGVRTRWGTGVGSTVAEIRQRHASLEVRQEPHPYSSPTWHYLVIDAPADTVHRIIFETNEQQRVDSYRVGFRRAVDLTEGCS